VGLQVTATAEMVVAVVMTVTEVFPDLVLSCPDVAVTVTAPVEAGGVNIPEELIVPALALQVTDEL